MRIACILIPSFAIAVERQANPRLADQPLIVYDRHSVVETSAPPYRGSPFSDEIRHNGTF